MSKISKFTLLFANMRWNRCLGTREKRVFKEVKPFYVWKMRKINTTQERMTEQQNQNTNIPNKFLFEKRNEEYFMLYNNFSQLIL